MGKPVEHEPTKTHASNPATETLKSVLNTETTQLGWAEFQILGGYVGGAIRTYDTDILKYVVETGLRLQAKLPEVQVARLMGIIDVAQEGITITPTISETEYNLLMPWEEQARKEDVQLQKPPEEQIIGWPIPPAYEGIDAIPNSVIHLKDSNLLVIRNFGDVFQPEITPRGRGAIKVFDYRRSHQ